MTAAAADAADHIDYAVCKANGLLTVALGPSEQGGANRPKKCLVEKKKPILFGIRF